MKKRVHIRQLRRLAGEQHGSTLVEFAITATLLMLILFGIIQWGFAMYAFHFTTWAAQQGARFAEVRGHTWSKFVTVNCNTSAPPNFQIVYDCTAQSSDIQNFVQSLETGGISSSSITVNTDNWPGVTPDGAVCTTVNGQGCMVKVRVSYTFNFMPFMNVTAMTIGATSEKVILQ